MFSFLKFDDFRVFGCAELGKAMLAGNIVALENPKATLVSVRHGRAVSIYENDLSWINAKGIGWTFGGPHVCKSTKDARCMFGIEDAAYAKREVEASNFLQKISDEYPQALGYKLFSEVELPAHLKPVLDIQFKNGERCEPCILFTRMKSPFRIADLAFLSDASKREVLDFYSDYFGSGNAGFIETFAAKLGERIGFLHASRIINDSLYYDNITMCAEIVDYEWLTVPGIPLPNGQEASDIMPQERREKEIIYSIEVMLRMADMLFLKRDFYIILEALLAGYEKHNKCFSHSSDMLIRMRKKEKFIW